MKLNTTGQLFEHNCQIKDMKLSGFNVSSLRYHCTVCGGQFLLKLDREKWEAAFGDNPSFRLTKKILQVLEEAGAEPMADEQEIEHEAASMEEPDPKKFRWEPAEDEEDEPVVP
jgi:hypothetical protein